MKEKEKRKEQDS